MFIFSKCFPMVLVALTVHRTRRQPQLSQVQTVCLGLLLGVQSGSEDDPNRKSLLTRADEEVTDLFKTYLAKFESTEEEVNAYKK